MNGMVRRDWVEKRKSHAKTVSLGVSVMVVVLL